MLMLPLVFSSVLAGDLVVDAKVPVSLTLDGEPAGEILRPGVLRLPLEEGVHTVVATVGGTPSEHKLTIGPGAVVMIVGRNGITVGAPDAAPPPASSLVAATGEVPVRFRSTGRDRLLVQVAGQRVIVSPGLGVTLPLSIGEHELTVRSPDGTSIFARGILAVAPGQDFVVQVSEGKLPETSGDGLAFDPVSK